jgi:glycosyltransferase involved in cell wall biosynthesis
MHVVHLIEALGSGGAERLLYTNLKHFDQTRIRSTVVTVYPHGTHWQDPIRELGIEVVSLNCDSPRDLPSGIKRFRSWLRQHEPDLIHSHLWAANVVARVAGRLAGIPVLSSIHNPDHEPQVWQDGANVSRAKRWAAKSIDRWTSWFGSTRMLAVSDYVRRSAHQSLHYPMSRIDLLYNPMDTDLLSSPVTRDRVELLRECGMPQDALLLLNVGRISPQKGLLYAVRALPRILERHSNAHLVSVGATVDRDWVTRLIDEARTLRVADHFHLVGARRDVADFLHACDVFVFPSLYEGLGIALIEAMAAGCLCVATNTGPIPEFVEHGINGMLVPPKDPEALATAVCELLSNREEFEQLAANAKDTVLDRFLPEAAAVRLTGIYEELLRNSR